MEDAIAEITLADRLEAHTEQMANTSWGLTMQEWNVISNDILLAARTLRALDEAQARVKRLEEALKFYADPNRWPNMPNPKNPHYDLEMDAGSRARFALHARAALNQEPGQ